MNNIYQAWAASYVAQEMEYLRTLIIKHPEKYVEIAALAGITPVSLSNFINKHSYLERSNSIAVSLVVSAGYLDFHRQVAEQTEKPND